MEYEDNPAANLKYLRSLSKNELRMYVKGYLMACVHIREAYSKGKYELLNRVLNDEGVNKMDTMRSIKLLDSYEEIVRKKEIKLLDLFPEFSENPRKTPENH